MKIVEHLTKTHDLLASRGVSHDVIDGKKICLVAGLWETNRTLQYLNTEKFLAHFLNAYAYGRVFTGNQEMNNTPSMSRWNDSLGRNRTQQVLWMLEEAIEEAKELGV